MNPRHLPVDERFTGFCVFCGGPSETKDHCPSKVLLDNPLPCDLPVVESCFSCNNGFSKDEEYFACFLECVVVGSVAPSDHRRLKIQKALERNSDMQLRINESCRPQPDGRLMWEPEWARINRVVIKNARGHAAYELSSPQLDEPSGIRIAPAELLSDADREHFEACDSQIAFFPELGSRSFHRVLGAAPFQNSDWPWVTVQEDRYRYAVSQTGGVDVRMVVADYLLCSVTWMDN